MKNLFISFLAASILMLAAAIVSADSKEGMPAMIAKRPMQADGIVRLSEIEVDPAYLEDYIKFATEVGEVSLRTEPGVLTMYAMSRKDEPNLITILETYASQADYKSHIASQHFQKYKKGTAHMVKSLKLLDQTVINPLNKLSNFMITVSTAKTQEHPSLR